jgi:hypothetical protein
MSGPKTATRYPLLGISVLYGASGFASLALETLWIRECLLRTGGTVLAAALVIGAFFAGSALGNRWGAEVASRCRRPLRRFAVLEAGSAFATVSLFLAVRFGWDSFNEVGFGGSMVLLLMAVLVPAALSGAAFPMLSEALVTGESERVPTGAVLYGSNLVGAACGVIAGAVVLPWYFGMLGAFLCAAGIQWIASGIAWGLARGEPVRSVEPAAPSERLSWQVALFALCGILSLATQGLLISWARQIHPGSLYSVSGVLGSFILGLGLGALIVSVLRRRGHPAAQLLPGFAALSSLMILATPFLGAWLVRKAPEMAGETPVQMVLHTLWWSILLLGPLTTCIGAVFPLSWDLIATPGKHQGQTLGRIVSWNKVGAAAGMVLAGFVILPWLGLVRGTLVVGIAYLALAVCLAAGRRRWGFAALAVAAVSVCLMFRPREPLGLEVGDSAVAAYHGSYGPVSVVDDTRNGSRFIVLNSQQRLNGTATALRSQRNQGWLPMLFASETRRVATIGMASGIST